MENGGGSGEKLKGERDQGSGTRDQWKRALIGLEKFPDP
jgi:hypothetical protein